MTVNSEDSSVNIKQRYSKFNKFKNAATIHEILFCKAAVNIMIPKESPTAVPIPGHKNVPTRAPVGTSIAIYNEPSFESS